LLEPHRGWAEASGAEDAVDRTVELELEPTGISNELTGFMGCLQTNGCGVTTGSGSTSAMVGAGPQPATMMMSND
jgi:hypothetical protein